MELLVLACMVNVCKAAMAVLIVSAILAIMGRHVKPQVGVR